MTDHHDAQDIADQIHALAETLMAKGACPTCVAKVLVAEGCDLGHHLGDLAGAKAVAEDYDGERPLRTH
jgi:hypothetical protein